MSDSVLEVTEPTCGYGDIVAVDGLSFTIGAGEIFGLAGAGGAGKSATIMGLAGLLPVRSGAVRLDGRLAVLGDDDPLTSPSRSDELREPRLRVPQRILHVDVSRIATAASPCVSAHPEARLPRDYLGRSDPPGNTSSPRTFCPP